MDLQTVSSTISSSNQIALPSLVRKRLGLKPGKKILWTITDEEIKVESLPSNWGKYMRGLGKEVWQKENVEKYINELRKDRCET